MRLLLWSLIRLLIVLPLLAIGVVILVLGLALSPWGAGLLLEEGAKRGLYQLERVEGAPLDRLVLHGFQLEAGPVEIAAERLELAWADDCLLRGRLCIERLAMLGGSVRLHETATAEPDEAARPNEVGDPIQLPLPMEIRELILQDTRVELADGTRIELERLATAAQAENSQLHLAASRADGLRVELPDTPESTPGADEMAAPTQATEPLEDEPLVIAPAPFRFPLDISAPELEVEDVELRLADGTRIGWDRLHTGIEAEDERLTLLPTRLVALQVAMPPAATALALDESGDVAVLDERALAAAEAVQAPATAVEAAVPLDQRERIALPDISLPLTVSAPRVHLDGVELSGPVDYTLRHLTLAFEASGQEVEIAALEVASLDADARLTARIALHDDYPLEARLEAALWVPELMPGLAGQRLELHLDGSLAELRAQLVASGPVDARLTARADVLDPTLPFSASAQSEFLQWPLPMTAALADETEEADVAEPFVVEDLELRASGSLEDYTAALSMRLEGPDIPLTRVALSGSGDFEHFAWTPLSLALGNASVVSRGSVEWREGLSLEATARLDNVDPGLFTEAMEGRLSGNVDVAFSQTPEGWQLHVPRLAIDGELQELPLSLRARLAGNSDMQWQVQEFDFRQGNNRITADGAISERRMDLSGNISLTELGSLHDELSGSVTGRFRTAGTPERPQLNLDLQGSELAFEDNRLEALQLTGSVRGLDDPELDVDLVIERLNAGGQRFSEVTLGLAGRLSSHRAELAAIAGRGMPLSRVALTLEGGLSTERQRYTGRIDPLEVDTDHGDMRLDEPIEFNADLAAGRIQVRPFCLRRQQGGQLCLDDTLQASADQGQVALSVRGLPMELLEEWLPEDWQASGATDLELQARWRQGGRQWNVEADLASELDLEGFDIYGQPWSMPDTRLNVRLNASQTRTDLDLDLALGDAGRLNLDIGLDDPLGRGELDGVLVLDGLDLSRYRTLAEGLDTLEGVVTGRVRIGGTRDNPSLDGALELTGLQASGLDVPLIVEDGRIRIEFNGDSARLMGYVASDEGRLVVDGNASWPSLDEWRIAVDLDGTRRPLLVTLPQFGRLRIAPEIAVRIDPQRLRVRGDVRVPWARLEIGEAPPAAVSPSPDEIIITRRDEARAQRREDLQATTGDDEAAAVALREAGMILDVRLELHLGPDMMLSASGLETGLAGTLQVRQQDGPVQLFGEVNLVDGRFRAFGQDLLIRQGQLLFSGPPDQPLLDFEAIRNPDITEDGVIAGLRVTGFAAEPSLEIFSEPAMDEARALSYLLRGRAPRDGDADGALTAALVGLTLGQTGGVVGAIGQAFGIDDLALETTGVGDESQVVVSGYLTEDLRVSYGVGIFSPIAELTLRYTLWRDLYVQAVSGAAQAIDLVYVFTRPGRPPRLESEP
ncbi:translocation/assembly module TamB [Billgrantia tianxiuensis]|jgi:translocation and assembly module TamB|uniref:Translocation/assembly module TamB n=2 Tax=Oceanospirillales TaxID=135619 RepID=A0A6I6STK7_9GAMM|nr:translocation/assembly module TamB domain-containing protein [Halomonas sp. MCCC 1A11057]MCE8031711.1 translocation/assembly module TamB [Halomonas sp. MCCC 1A11057]QHC52124.1 translocation/assembly module TamB [Halomonas tianxiuensis]